MHPEITSLEQINRERERFDQLRRTIFIVAGLLGLAIIAYDTNDMLHQPTPSTWLVLGNNVFFGLFAAAMAGLAMAGRAALRLRGIWPDRALRGLRRDAEAVQEGLNRTEVRHV